MFEDMINSQKLMTEYTASQNARWGVGNQVQNIDFNTEILTSGHWPYQDVPKCNIPRQMVKVQEVFTQFYTQKFQNRQILWLFNHGSLQLKTNYLPKSYQLMVSCFQASILFLFNEFDVLTVKDIQSRLAISEQDFTDSMLKLCNPKSKVLLKENAKVPKFAPDENIKINPKFENNNIKVPLVP